MGVHSSLMCKGNYIIVKSTQHLLKMYLVCSHKQQRVAYIFHSPIPIYITTVNPFSIVSIYKTFFISHNLSLVSSVPQYQIYKFHFQIVYFHSLDTFSEKLFSVNFFSPFRTIMIISWTILNANMGIRSTDKSVQYKIYHPITGRQQLCF